MPKASKRSLLLFGGFIPLIWLAAAAEEGLPSPGMLVTPLIVIAILVILNGLFVAAEFAIIGIRPSQLEYLAGGGHRTAKVALATVQSTDNLNRYIATAQLGITLASLGLGMYGEPALAHFIEPYLAHWLGYQPADALVTSLGYLLSVGFLTYLHVVFGEMIPKSVALSAPDRAVFAITSPMQLSQLIFSLPVRALNAISNGLLWVFRIAPAEGHARLHSAEELELIVSESVQGGLLNKEEEAIIGNVFDFGNRQVNQLMTPRTKVEAVPLGISLRQLLEQAAQSRRSRLPVYEGNLDNIVGLIHVKDLLHHQQRSQGNFDIRLLLRAVPVVPGAAPAKNLLGMLKNQRIHMAIVLDEYGGTAGLVTLEDLVEEIVGEVRDEFDRESEPIIWVSATALEVIGSFSLDDLQEYVDLGAPEARPDVDTVSGLIMTELGRLPQIGDTFVYRQTLRFTVLTIDGLAVGRALVEALPKQS